MFQPDLADIRFGCGLSPRLSPPQSVGAMLAGLTGPDQMAQDFPIESFDQFRHRIGDFNIARKGSRQNRGTDKGAEFDLQRKALVKSAKAAYTGFVRDSLLRRIHTETGFRERLSFFWADHFTAHGKVMIIKWSTSPYVQDAIRPHISGKFEDLLIAAVTHPLMLSYLDQNISVGPNSTGALRQKTKRGLNENLAREVLELHTLGVGGPYTQDDVRQLAELFTGLSYKQTGEFVYKAHLAEPGPETILGKSYGGRKGRLEDIHAALRDLARHPATAKHIARKLAQHFVADSPSEALVHALETAYRDTEGDLTAVYTALLEHPDSWAPALANVKQPLTFMASAFRALDIGQTTLKRTRDKDLRNMIYIPLQIMGQPWEKPGGPDGWPEENNHWITPQFMAARLQWALAVPQALRKSLPDPRDFAKNALGDLLPQDVAFAAGAAENRWEGVALVLTSPAFQRQ